MNFTGVKFIAYYGKGVAVVTVSSSFFEKG